MAIHKSLQSLAVPIAALTLDPANARKHPGRNLEVIKASLRDFGQRKPIVVRREGMVVIAGNGTLTAAKELGWSEIAAVQVDDDQLKATRYGIVDNRSAELAEWDDGNLSTLLGALMDNDVSMDDMGFSASEIANLKGTEEEEDGQTVKDLNPIVRYDIIFDNVQQQDRFYKWMKHLKGKHAQETVAGRIDAELIEMGM